MRTWKKVLLGLSVLAVTLIVVHLFYLNNLSQSGEYPEDTYLSTESNKRAVIIVAHDDDAISMSGTISYLTEQNWEVSELCFYQGWKDKDETRKRDLKITAELLGMKEVEYHDFILSRNEERNKQPWMPVPVEQFDSLYNTAEAYNYVAGFIEKHQPAVIFTLDDIMGGYGHPEHVLMSQMVIKYCQNHHQDSLFSVKRIYQAVFDPMMNEKILKDMDAFQSGKNVYGVSQSPNPDVYLSLEGREEIKKKAMLSYTTEQNSLTKIWPFYQYYPAKIYFSIFDKEYYRILTKEEGFHSDRENML